MGYKKMFRELKTHNIILKNRTMFLPVSNEDRHLTGRFVYKCIYHTQGSAPLIKELQTKKVIAIFGCSPVVIEGSYKYEKQYKLKRQVSIIATKNNSYSPFTIDSFPSYVIDNAKFISKIVDALRNIYMQWRGNYRMKIQLKVLNFKKKGGAKYVAAMG